jgi:hypothetical protein
MKKKDAKENYGQGNRNFQIESNQELFIDIEGLTGKKEDFSSHNSLANYDDDKKNTDQEGYADDSDFGQQTVKSTSAKNKTDVNNDFDEDENTVNTTDEKKDVIFDKSLNPQEHTTGKNRYTEKKNNCILAENRSSYHSVFHL